MNMDHTTTPVTNLDGDTYQADEARNRIRSSMTIDVAHLRIRRDLNHAEAALDEALLRQSRLLSTMVHARRASGVAPFVGQDALHRLVRSQQAMLNAGGELARVHGRLSGIALEVGATETMVGNDPCPTTAFGMAGDDAFVENPIGQDCLTVHPRAA